ncbi:MAG: amidophosphoribosyltransferase [Nanoarchaeota archaeon]
MCGVIGLFADSPVAKDLCSGLLVIQHRGQDSAGIGTFDEKFHIRKGNGLVPQILSERSIAHFKGNMGIGQVRYPTIGGGCSQDAQPFLVNSPYGILMVHNGNITNYYELKEELLTKNKRILESENDVEVVLNVFADELAHQELNGLSPEQVYNAVDGVFKRVKGAYSCISIIAGKGMVAFRDPYGIRPLIMGRRGNEYAFVSETAALDYLGYTYVKDVGPGEVIFIDQQRKVHSKTVRHEKHHPCIFEIIYFARPDSLIDKISVYKSRLRMGTELAKLWKESGFEADVVIPVPDTSRPAALAFAEETGIKYREGFIKNKYVHRTFIMSSQEKRTKSVKEKLNPLQLEIKGKNIAVVDDSIVRGTTSKKIVELLRETGAKKVYFISSAPPLISPCVYGIDMQTRKELIAHGKKMEEIKDYIGADGLIYQTIPGLIRACHEGNPEITQFCTACFDGNYPTKDVTPDMLAQIEEKRSCKKQSS